MSNSLLAIFILVLAGVACTKATPAPGSSASLPTPTLEYATPGSLSAPTPPIANTCQAVVSAGQAGVGRLRLRSGPANTYPEIDVLTDGQVIQVLGVDGDWLRVLANGEEGYVYSDYVEECDE